MKTTLIVIENEADHAQAKALVAKLMGSTKPEDRARLVAQARLIETYERTRWPRRRVRARALGAYLTAQKLHS
jgi:HTH-type transcriptional regulator/antitoxin HigA